MRPKNVNSESESRWKNCWVSSKSDPDTIDDLCYKNVNTADPSILIALVGDSLAMSYYRIIDFEDANNYSTFVKGRDSCIIPAAIHPSEFNKADNCIEWGENVIDKIIALSHKHSATILIINGYYQKNINPKNVSYFISNVINCIGVNTISS